MHRTLNRPRLELNEGGPPNEGRALRWAHRFALAAAVFTWPLLLVGGTVSVHRVGMAVPDWPTTFGVNMFYYNMFEAPWGVFAEHSHRLYGSAVGLACIGLVAVFGLAWSGARGLVPLVVVVLAAAVAMINPRGEWNVLGQLIPRGLAALMMVGLVSLAMVFWSGLVRRDRVLALAWLALAAVVGQGVLGGYRVRWNSTMLAFIHGWTAQLFFALLVLLWVITSRRWLSGNPVAGLGAAHARRGLVLIALLVGQIVAGAYVRHFGSIWAILVHGVLALGVLAHVALVARSAWRAAPGFSEAGLSAPSFWMVAWSLAQVVLGLLALWVLWPFDGIPRPVGSGQALVRVSHQGVGALLLGSAIVFVARALRPRAEAPVPGSSEARQRVSRVLEAVS